MFRKEMLKNLKAIFGMEATFDAPSDSFEQNKIFVEVEAANNRVTFGKESSIVRGWLVLYCQDDKVPYGFFNKKIHQASAENTKNFTFSQFDTEIASSGARMVNLREKRTRFVYLYAGQYDPGGASMDGIQVKETLRIADGDGSLIESGDGPLEGDINS